MNETARDEQIEDALGPGLGHPYHEPSSLDVALASLALRTILRPYYARLVRGLGLRGDERVIDFGSGPGAAAVHLAAALSTGRGQVTCVDVSKAWLRAAQKMTERYTNVAFKLGEIATLDIADGAYDVVFFHFVLHDIPAERRAETVRHLAAKLRAHRAGGTGGRLFLREPTGKGHGMPPDEIDRLMTGAGLRQVFLDTGRLLWIQPICDGLYLKPG
jgi:SAM-dependent methyltransferase